jgi:hypothetical protein
MWLSKLKDKIKSEFSLQLIAKNKLKPDRSEDAWVLDLVNCGLLEVEDGLEQEFFWTKKVK